MSDDHNLAKLKEFIVHNDKLDVLEARLKEFNPLKVLGVQHHEIRHSNILAWLLDPQESHGLGDKVLKKILSEAIVANENIEPTISIMKIQDSSFHDAQVFREWNNIDILVVSKNNRFIFLIENKLGPKGSSGQIKKYIEKIKIIYPGFLILPIMLTLEEEGDEDETAYGFLSHAIVYDVITSVLELHRDNVNSKIYDFLNYYIKTLGVLTMQTDNEVVQLCRDIYKKHKEAIDAIISYGIAVTFNEAIDGFLKGNNLIESQRRHIDFWFVPAGFKGKVPETAVDWLSPFVISYWFRFKTDDNKLRLILEVGPFKDSDQRVKFLSFLRKEFKLFRVPDRSLDSERRYTRISSASVHFDEWDDPDKLAAAMENLYKNKFKETNETIMKAISKFQW